MLDTMSSGQLAEWMAYYAIEPFGVEFLDAHFSQLNATMVNKDRKKAHQVEPGRFRLLKDQSQKWDPQAWFDGLKEAFSLKKD